MSARPIRVLLVEDEENDALLVMEDLRTGGFDPSWERVQTPEEMEQALDRSEWDIVISDYVLPRFSGLAALQLVQKKTDIPLILISGHLSEEEAVDAMRAGARDFISKNNMARLVPAVERELREAQLRRERRQAREQLRAEQEHRLEFYRRLVLAATDNKLVITDPAEIQKIAGPAIVAWEFTRPEDLAGVRHRVTEAAREAGMDEGQIGRFILAVGEASTNTIKHAGSGTASIHVAGDSMVFLASDRGPGIAALSLPEVAVRSSYSTVGTLGVGFKVMIKVADRVYLASGPEGTTVGIQMSISPSEAVPEFIIGPVCLTTTTKEGAG